MSCELTGTYAHWFLTPAQGGTFVELEMGMEPRRFGDRLFDVTRGKRYFRRWSQQSLDALREVTGEEPFEAAGLQGQRRGVPPGPPRDTRGTSLGRGGTSLLSANTRSQSHETRLDWLLLP